MKRQGTKIGRSVRVNKRSGGKDIHWYLSQPVDLQLELMGHHLEICRIVINTLLEADREELCGQRYSRQGSVARRYSRWGYNPGSVRLGSQKLPVEVPRVYDREQDKHIPLERYARLRQLPEQNRQMVESVLCGMSMRDFGRVVDKLVDSFGLSGGSVSRRFQEHSREALEAFERRKLGQERYVALVIDGKELAAQQMVIVLGITDKGRKMPLGLIQTTTENARSIGQLLKDLVARGLNYEEGLLVVCDGSRGIRKAVEQVFGGKALIQRCRWHKRENLVSYLWEDKKQEVRERMEEAWRQPTYEKAKERLLDLKKEIEVMNRSAARSLEEGLEETLTLHKLGLNKIFSKSLATTNCMESVNAQLDKYLGRVKRWMNSEQRYRWVVLGLLDIETRLRRIAGYKKLGLLQASLKEHIQKGKKHKKTAA